MFVQNQFENTTVVEIYDLYLSLYMSKEHMRLLV